MTDLLMNAVIADLSSFVLYYLISTLICFYISLGFTLIFCIRWIILTVPINFIIIFSTEKLLYKFIRVIVMLILKLLTNKVQVFNHWENMKS